MRDPSRIYLNNTVLSPNAFNFIYANADVPIGEGLAIRRFSFDNHSSVVYFLEEFDFTRYDIWLIDDFGKYCALDASFVENDGRTLFPDRSVWFAPLSLGVRGFTLGFADRVTGEVLEQSFGFEATHGMVADMVFERLTSIRKNDGTTVGTVHAAHFSSTGTNLFFTFDGRVENIRFGQDVTNSALTLTERGRTIHPLSTGVRTHFAANGDILYRADFHPINFYEGVVDFTFRRLFTTLPINAAVNAVPLMNNLNPNNHVVFETGGYLVTLQFITPHLNDTWRMFLHSIDLSVPAPEDPSDRSNRREVLIDCHLVITMPNGERVILHGTDARSRDIGSDIFFRPGDSPQYAELILAGQYRNMELVVGDALIRTDDINIRIDLDQIVGEGRVFERDIKHHFTRNNADKERYSVAVVMFERLGRNHRALMREIWYDAAGERHVRTSEVYGYVDPYLLDMEIIVLHESRGLY
jgi:hypothetical protein